MTTPLLSPPAPLYCTYFFIIDLQNFKLNGSFTERICALDVVDTSLTTVYERQAKNCVHRTTYIHSLRLYSVRVFLCTHSMVTERDSDGGI